MVVAGVALSVSVPTAAAVGGRVEGLGRIDRQAALWAVRGPLGLRNGC